MNDSPLNDLIRSYEDLDDRFRLMCPEFLKTVKSHTECEPFIADGSTSVIRTHEICFSSNDFDVDKKFNNSVRFIIEVVLAIKRMGFDINILSIEWFNVKDACYNIMGDKGCFYVRYEFKEKTHEKEAS